MLVKISIPHTVAYLIELYSGTGCSNFTSGDTCCTDQTTSSQSVCGSDQTCSSSGCITTPRAPASVGSWQSQYCWSDSIDSRALSNSFQDSTALTPSECFSKADGYQFAGLEYGVECWYGNNLALSSSLVDSGCDMPCAGDSTALCGGNIHMNLYFNTAYKAPTPTTSGSPTQSPSPPPVIVPTVRPSYQSFGSRGCFSDSSSSRGLPSKSVSTSFMTVERCIALAGNSKYAAIEYGRRVPLSSAQRWC